jgi:hypothetical protein
MRYVVEFFQCCATIKVSSLFLLLVQCHVMILVRLIETTTMARYKSWIVEQDWSINQRNHWKLINQTWTSLPSHCKQRNRTQHRNYRKLRNHWVKHILNSTYHKLKHAIVSIYISCTSPLLWFQSIKTNANQNNLVCTLFLCV